MLLFIEKRKSEGAADFGERMEVPIGLLDVNVLKEDAPWSSCAEESCGEFWTLRSHNEEPGEASKGE